MSEILPIEIVLKQNEETFSNKEKLISDFVLKNLKNYKKLKITTIRKECQVSSSTIYSFFEKIHIKSIYDLWEMISQENAIRYIEVKDDSSSSNVEQIYQDIIAKNSHLITNDLLNQFIELLNQANNIYIIGSSTSNVAANELSRRLSRFGFNAFSFESEQGEMILKTITMKPNDLLISMSMSGETKAIVYATEMAKKNGTKIVAISGSHKSSLTSLADFEISLFSAPFGNNDTTLFSPLVSYLYLIDSLISRMLDLDFDYYMNKRKTIATKLYNFTKK